MKKIKVPYLISLPERTVKSLVSLSTGISSLLTKLLLPDAVKQSSTYRVTFGMLQQFLIEKVAKVEEEEKDIVLKDKYVIRKTAGSMIEGIGLVSIRFSPVWMLAILSDISGGSKVYLERLVKDLKKNNLVKEETSYDNIYELLEGIKLSSKIGVDAIDMPPITVDEFVEFKDTLVNQFKENNVTTGKMFKDFESLYKQMNETSKKEQISLSKLNGAMTLDLMKQASKKGIDFTLVTTKTSMSLLHEVTIQSYKDSLNRLQHVGKRKYLIEHMTPFMKQFKKHYQQDNKTITESVIHFFQRKK